MCPLTQGKGVFLRIWHRRISWSQWKLDHSRLQIWRQNWRSWDDSEDRAHASWMSMFITSLYSVTTTDTILHSGGISLEQGTVPYCEFPHCLFPPAHYLPPRQFFITLALHGTWITCLRVVMKWNFKRCNCDMCRLTLQDKRAHRLKYSTRKQFPNSLTVLSWTATNYDKIFIYQVQFYNTVTNIFEK